MVFFLIIQLRKVKSCILENEINEMKTNAIEDNLFNNVKK